MKVIFRVDASIEMGTGHVMRCLTLADELSDKGTEITFITRKHNGNMDDVITKRGHNIFSLSVPTDTYQDKQDDVPHASWLGVPWEQDAMETGNAIGTSSTDWLIVDHYGIDARWHKELRDQVKQIMVIDDLADRPLDCDMLLDQTYGRQEEDYRQWVNPSCQMLLGSHYALLRPRFSELRPKAIEKRKRLNGINRVLLSMGGIDTDNVTAIILEGLSLVDWQDHPIIDVVMGSKAPHLKEVISLAEGLPLEISVSTDVSDMAERMLEADLALGAGGATTWERCCLGLPTLIISLAKNQMLIAHGVDKAGASIHIGNVNRVTVNTIKESVQLLNDNGGLIQEMADNGFQLVDGLGATRLLECMDLK